MDMARRHCVARSVRPAGPAGMIERSPAGRDPAPARADVLLLGADPTALTALCSLIEWCNVLGVLRAAADPVGDPLRTYAAQHGIPVLAVGGMNELRSILPKFRPE